MKMTQTKVRNMQSPNGNDVPNQFIIESPEGRIFQSYASVIALIKPNGDVWLDESDWDYSPTTSKYRNIFLNETSKETVAKIKSGEYELTNLN